MVFSTAVAFMAPSSDVASNGSMCIQSVVFVFTLLNVGLNFYKITALYSNPETADGSDFTVSETEITAK